MCLIQVNYLFLILGWLTLTIARIPPYSASCSVSPFNLHKSTYLDLVKMLYDRRHHVDAALQGNLLISEIPSPIKLQVWDWLIAFYRPLGEVIPTPFRKVNTKDLSQPQWSGLWNAYDPSFHPNDILLMPRTFECLASKHNIALISFQCLYTAPDKFLEPNKIYINSAWDPNLVLTALMYIEEDDREDIVIDLEPPRQFRPRPLSNQFGIYCTRNTTMHQQNERAGHSDTKR